MFGALGQPILFWLLLSAGLNASFRPAGAADGTNSLTWFFPGIIIMVLLFTAIFSTISIIEDRREGFLQSVLVAPSPRTALVLGKILGGTLLAAGQGALLLAAAPFIGISVTVPSLALALVVLLAVAFALTGLGVCIAWPMESTQGFHMIMNVFLLPMWLLSGSFFPLDGAPIWMRIAMQINPLTYGVAALRRVLAPAALAPGSPVPGLALSLAVTAAFCSAAFAAAWTMVRFRGTPGTR